MPESKWSNEDVFQFIELYKMEPAIWNPKHKFHKDKNRVNDAWKRIAEEMGIEVPELKKKKETLMVAFRLNHKKVLASTKSATRESEIFKPIWIYYDALASFMSDVYKCKSLTTDDEESVSFREEPNADADPIEIYVQEPELKMAEALKQITTTITALTNNVLNNRKENEDECDLYGRLLAYKLKSFSDIERQEIMYEIDGLLLKRINMC